MKTKRLTELALLSAIALTIFIIEQKIPNPFPVPGVKLGLANIVTVYALYRYRLKEVFLLVMTRVILGAVFGGNLMALHRLIPERILWTGSVLGAVLHNIGQITVAVLVMKSTAVLMYFPFLLVSGCCAGAFTGLSAMLLLRRNPYMASTARSRSKTL